MDYRDESEVTSDIRWNDRVTYDGTWENNLFNFFMKVTPKLTEDLKKPFRLENQQRIDDTPVHRAVREAFVNLIIHSDYQLDAGTLKIIKRPRGFEFTNPGILKLPIDEIFKGGNSKPRNPRMQTMFRMVGFGDNAGSGFPAILDAWRKSGWIQPQLTENTILNQVTLTLYTIPAFQEALDLLAARVSEYSELPVGSIGELQRIFKDMDLNMLNASPALLSDAEKMLCDKLSDARGFSADSAEKSADSAENVMENTEKLSDRQKQVLLLMKEGVEYSTEEIAALIGLKGPRTRQILNELVSLGRVKSTAATKSRRYIKII
ncbi:MAG: ATP-binding protein [Lachnospiraceae bacterium]|nr:ATP-binding protein [Lachnospiraceae bacterium]